MFKDIHYETFDGKCYVNVRIMKTSPLYNANTDSLPLFLEGKVKVFSSNTPKNAPPSIALDKEFYTKWKMSEDNKPTSKSIKWYFSFVCEDRFEADRVIGQIHELEGLDSEERNHLLFNSKLGYVGKYGEGELAHLKAVSEMTVSLDMDASQKSEHALKLICGDKKKRTLSKLFSKGQYENFALTILGQDNSEVVVNIKKGKFFWTYMKYTNPKGKVIERWREYGH